MGSGGGGAPARSRALDVLEQVEAGAFLAPALSAVLDRSGLTGPDRSLVTEIVYGVARWRLRLDAALAPLLRSPGRLPPRALLALRAGAFELLVKGTPPHAAVSSWVAVVKRERPALAGVANAVLRRLAGSVPARDESSDPASSPRSPSGAGTTEDLATALALPVWLWRELESALGADARAAAAGMLEPEPLWLTAFSPHASDALRAAGCEVSPGPLGSEVPTSLAVRAPKPLAELDAYREGLVQPQNPASLFVARALGAAAGELVYDLASGRGVKSAVLAASGARVTAVEIDERRGAAAERNLRRLGLTVRHLTADLLAPLPAELEPDADRVLLDAPCSGTGTLRGHPEIKLRLEPQDVERLAAQQLRMLGAAAGLVAPGGTLLYAVCALTLTEGPGVAEAFLAEHRSFEPDPPECPLPHVRSGPGGLFVLSVGGLDGFYLARFRRRRADETLSAG